MKKPLYETEYQKQQGYCFDGEHKEVVTVLQSNLGDGWCNPSITYASMSGLNSDQVVELANMLKDAAKVMDHWSLASRTEEDA